MTKSMGLFALTAAAVALGACSDTITSPPTRSASGADYSVTLGTNSVTVASDASTQHCGTMDVVGQYSFSGSITPIACTNATTTDLTSALAVYNPGWSAPISGSDWIGVTSNGGPSSDYRAETGTYVFQETFNIPAGATAPSLNLNTKSDNAVGVYLNGKLISSQTVTDCNSGTCNWNQLFNVTDATAADFNIGGANNLTVVLINTPIGFGSTTAGIGGTAPTYGCYRDPQTDGEAGFSGTFNVATIPAHSYAGRTKTTDPTTHIGCENPTGVDYKGTVSWTPPAVTTWCSPGFWKNHPTSPPWPAALLSGPLSFYNHYTGLYARDPQSISGNPTLLQVVSNPSTYHGPATNNVADVISNAVFGTPIINAEIESCPDPSQFPNAGGN